MKTNIFIVAIAILFVTSCSFRKSQDNSQDVNKDNLREYLSQSFNIDMDTLTTKLVLINYIGCRPCINMHLDYISKLNAESKDGFMYVVPLASYNEFSQNCPETNSTTIMIDSANNMCRKNIQIDGLSVYNIVNGEILEVKTIKLSNVSEQNLQNFWMKW